MSLKTAEQVLNEMLGTQGLTLDQALSIVQANVEAAKDSNTITVREGQSVQAANTASDYVIVCPGTYTEANSTITLRANTRVVPEIPNTVIFDCGVVIEAEAVLGYGIQVTGTVSGAGIALTDPATSPLYFGDGSDGAFTVIVSTGLTDCKSWSDLTIPETLSCFTNGLPLICSGKLLVEGTLSDYQSKNGNNGSAGIGSGTTGGEGGASLAKTVSSAGIWYHWKNGNASAFGVGGRGGVSGMVAQPGTSPGSYMGYVVFPIGGSTGAGGTGGGTACGVGGTNLCSMVIYPLAYLLKGAIGLWSADAGWRYLYGGVNGPGGGGGARGFDGDSIYANGGGGGGGGLGGGIVTIYANELEVGANGVIAAPGGNGGNGGDGVGTYGGGGGGGAAGGGGVVAVLCNKLTCADDISNHINVAGGIGGSGGSLTNLTESRRGASGANGYDGRWMVVELSTGRIWHG